MSDDLLMWLLSMVPIVALSIGLVLVYCYAARLQNRICELEHQLEDVPRRFKGGPVHGYPFGQPPPPSPDPGRRHR